VSTETGQCLRWKRRGLMYNNHNGIESYKMGYHVHKNLLKALLLMLPQLDFKMPLILAMFGRANPHKVPQN
jgi:hypothetical protein